MALFKSVATALETDTIDGSVVVVKTVTNTIHTGMSRPNSLLRPSH